MIISAAVETFELSKPFGISRGQKTEARVVKVTLSEGKHQGFGEGVPYARYGDSPEVALEQIQSLPGSFTRESLVDLLPPSSARNAVDAALWSLEASSSGRDAETLFGIRSISSLPMGATVSLSSPEEMEADAKRLIDVPLVKVKLGGDEDQEALARIRQALPDARLLVDANEGWSPSGFLEMIPHLIQARVELVEQPLPADLDGELSGIDCPIPTCADESFYPRMPLTALADKFDFVNIKLDKSGGLTQALRDIETAKSLGMGVMVGCMVSSSLAIAPAFIAAQLADYSDLDGFLSIKHDREPAMVVAGGQLSLPAGLWI